MTDVTKPIVIDLDGPEDEDWIKQVTRRRERHARLTGEIVTKMAAAIAKDKGWAPGDNAQWRRRDGSVDKPWVPGSPDHGPAGPRTAATPARTASGAKPRPTAKPKLPYKPPKSAVLSVEVAQRAYWDKHPELRDARVLKCKQRMPLALSGHTSNDVLPGGSGRHDQVEVPMDHTDDREPVVKDVRVLIPIEKNQSQPQRITYGVVLEPDTEDLQGDVMTAEDIEKAAYEWMERSQSGGRMHSEVVKGAKVVESYIAPCDIPVETADGTQTIRKGSWVLAMRWPPEIWESIQKGELTGYSVGGTGVRLALEHIGKKGKWAPGPNAGWRLANGDPAGEGAAAAGGGTPADRGAAAARNEGKTGDHRDVVEGMKSYRFYSERGASAVTALDDGPARSMKGLHGRPFTFAPGAEAFLVEGTMTKGTITPVTMLRHGKAPLPNYEVVANDSYFVEVGFTDGSKGIVISNRLGVPENYNDAAPEYREALRRAGVGQVKKAGKWAPGPNAGWRRMTPAEEGEEAPEVLLGAVRKGLCDAVAKHGSHDQSSHGNWARGKTYDLAT
jgi:hypothetical protein